MLGRIGITLLLLAIFLVTAVSQVLPEEGATIAVMVWLVVGSLGFFFMFMSLLAQGYTSYLERKLERQYYEEIDLEDHG